MKLRDKKTIQSLPTSQLGQQFCQYFNCGKYFIYRVKNNWLTETRFIASSQVLWRRHQDPRQVIGIRFNDRTNFFVVDLDVGSEYHYRYNPFDFYALTECLKKMGIAETVKLQSSGSGGIHLFGFLPQKVNSFKLACALEKCLTTNGFQIKPGQLEIFPNPKPYNQPGVKSVGYNGIRLPLQPDSGSKLYNSKMRLVNGGIKKLLKLANKTKQEQNMALLKRYANQAVKWHKKQKSMNYQEQRRQNYQQDLKIMAFSGWSDRTQTNEILKALTNYGWVVKELRDEKELAKYIAETAVVLPGYEQYCNHKHEISRRAKHWAKSGCRYWAQKWAYPDRKGKTYNQFIKEVNQGINAEIRPNTVHPRYSYINEKRKTEFRDRLNQCITDIGRRNLPRKVKECLELLQNKSLELFGTKFSVKTLRKSENRHLWHYKYRPRILSSAPFVILKAIAIQGELLQQYLGKILERVTDMQQNKKQSERIAQKKTPQKDVIQSLKTPQKIAKNPVVAIGSKKDPTMKCLVPQLRVRLKVRLWVSSRISKFYKNELKFTSLQIYQHTPNSIDQVEKESSTLLSQLKTSETKFQEIRKARKKLYFYHGSERSSRSALSSRRDELKSLKPGTKIKILTDCHSSTLMDDNRQILVYVRPTEIKTKEKYLVPLESLVPVLDHENYNSALLPLVKKLVQSLGLNKMDYHDYLRKNYQVCRTQYLTGTQLFQTIKYYESLLIDLQFDS